MPRTAIPKQTEKIVYQQAGSRCSFCDFDQVPSLDLHHIQPVAQGGSNEPENLILTCRNCHGLIHDGKITEAQVRQAKASQGAVIHRMPKRSESKGPSNVVSAGRDIKGSIIAGGDVHMHSGSGPRPKMNHPEGSIGADLMRRNYVDHLIKRYNKFRQAGASYGQKGGHRYGVLQRAIIRKYKVSGVYFVPLDRFDELTFFIQGKIDQTIQGKANRSRGHSSYSSFEQYLAEQQPGS